MFKCPECGASLSIHRNPIPTVDIIIELQDLGKESKIIMIKRRNYPHGWALPGGFIDYGESAEEAAIREAKEETSLDVTLKDILGVYSRPGRDPRFHTISIVFTAFAEGQPAADDDAVDIDTFSEDTLPAEIAFDHREIIADYFLKTGDPRKLS